MGIVVGHGRGRDDLLLPRGIATGLVGGGHAGEVIGSVEMAEPEARPGWRDALDSWRIQAVLVPPNVRIAHALVADKGWRPVYSDPKAIIFIRAPRVRDAAQ